MKQQVAKTKTTIGSRIFDSRQSIKQTMAVNNPIYNSKIQKILHSNYKDIEELDIFTLQHQPTPYLYYFHADKYSSDIRQPLEQYILKTLDHHHNNHQETYALVYVHNSFTDFINFRKIIEKWPEHLFHKLRRVYILQPSIMVKVIETFSFGHFYELLDQIFINITDEDHLKQVDEEVMKALGEDPKKIPKKMKAVLENALYGKQIRQYDLYTGKYPTILLRLLHKIINHKQGLLLEGIFRKSCDSEALELLENQIIKENWKYLEQEQDVLVLCGCLKKILNNLRIPLFNFSIYAEIIAYTPQKMQSEVQFIRSLLLKMEYVNQKVFLLLVAFLKRKIIANQAQNKMNAYNLAVVFGPCFFRPKEYDLQDLIYSGKFAKVIITCLSSEDLFEAAEINLANSIIDMLERSQIQF